MQSVAYFIIWGNYIADRITPVFALFENDGAGKSKYTGEEQQQLFQYAIDNIPLNIWLAVASGQITEIPDFFLSGFHFESKGIVFSEADNLHFLIHQNALLQMVILLKTKDLTGFERFIQFLNWYADHLIIAESMFVYAALVFSETPSISKPKHFNSSDFSKIMDGINNQAWDMCYLSHWSSFVFDEINGRSGDSSFLFATNDDLLKNIAECSFVKKRSAQVIENVFGTDYQLKELEEISSSKFGSNRKRPFGENEISKGIDMLIHLRDSQLELLQNMISDH